MFAHDEFDVIPPDLRSGFFEAQDMSGFEHYDDNSDTTYASLKINGVVIGLASISISEFGVNVGIIEIKADERGQKAGTKLASHIFNYVRDLAAKGQTKACISTPGFTDDGKKYLLPQLAALEAQNPDVQFYTYPSC